MEKVVQTWREKDGRPIHDGDCHFWGLQICTCGLIHRLSSISKLPEGWSDWYNKEWGMHERQVERIPKPLPWVEPTEEEMDKRMKILDEIFTKEVFKPKTPAEIAMARRKEYKEIMRRERG